MINVLSVADLTFIMSSYCELIECSRPIRFFIVSLMYNNMVYPSDRRTVLDDSELDTLVRDIQREFPNGGYRRIHSQLKSRGVKVTQSRVRESMHDFVEPVRLCKMAIYLLQWENRKVHSVCIPTRL